MPDAESPLLYVLMTPLNSLPPFLLLVKVLSTFLLLVKVLSTLLLFKYIF
jgi:hypothetical protein